MLISKLFFFDGADNIGVCSLPHGLCDYCVCAALCLAVRSGIMIVMLLFIERVLYMCVVCVYAGGCVGV